MQKILIPTELTFLSQCALQLGLEFANKAGASLEVLSVIETNESLYMEKNETFHNHPMSSLKNIELTEEARQRMQERVKEIESFSPELGLTPKILFGDRTDILVEEVKSQSVDLVIMGGDLYNPTDKKANDFLRSVDVPVLILKCMISGLEQFNDIIYLVDPERDSKQMIAYLNVLQKLLDAKIHVLRIQEKKNFLQRTHHDESLETYADRHGLSNFTLVEKESKTEKEGLLEYCESIEHAFVALASHERTFLQSLIGNKDDQGEIIANSVHPLWMFRN